jgi:hypothetical protein
VVRPGLKRQRGGSSHSPREQHGSDPSTWLRNMRAPVEVTPLGAKVVVDPKTGRRLVLGPAVAAKLTAPEVGDGLLAVSASVHWPVAGC